MLKALPFAALAALALATPAHALLSPYWQTAAEVRAILASGAVNDALKTQEPITSVVRTAPDVYEVRAGNCSVTVNIVDAPAASGQMMMGPRKFDLQVGQGTCQ